jgi:hypothetical protein
MYEIYIKGPILAKNLVFTRMVTSLCELTKLPSAWKMRLFLYYQDSRDNKPLTGSNTPTIYDLYGRDFFNRQIDFALESGKNINNIKIFNKKQQSKNKYQKMTEF